MAEQALTALIGGIQKYSTEDGPGIRTTVFLKGCPLHCRWCHNPELIRYGQELIQMPNNCIHCGYCLGHCPQNAIYVDEEQKIRIDREKCDLCLECTRFCYAQALTTVAKRQTAEEVMHSVLQDKEFYDQSGGGMTISGGEMLTQPEFAEALIDLAAKEGIRVCLDTSGCGDGDTLLRLAAKENVTNILYDMKSIDGKVHEWCTGKGNELILANLERLADDENLREKIMMRMPLIKGINDTQEIIRATGDFYRAHGIRKVTLLPYHDLGLSKSRNIGREQERFEPPSEERVEEIRRFFEEECGMEVEILGKVK